MNTLSGQFCEQSDPKVLVEAARANSLAAMRRVQASLLAKAEKQALLWMAERTPAWINSDHLTLLGLGAQVMAGASYALARGIEGGCWRGLPSSY